MLTGTKHFSTCSAIADYIIMLVRTGQDRYKGLSVLLMGAGTPGVTFTEMPKLGIWTNHTYNITLDQARIPYSAAGRGGPAVEVITHSLDVERFTLAAAYTGAAQSAYDYAAEYARTREQFGSPIGKFQVIAHKLVDMHIAIDHSRLVTSRVAGLLDAGLSCRLLGGTTPMIGQPLLTAADSIIPSSCSPRPPCSYRCSGPTPCCDAREPGRGASPTPPLCGRRRSEVRHVESPAGMSAGFPALASGATGEHVMDTVVVPMPNLHSGRSIGRETMPERSITSPTYWTRGCAATRSQADLHRGQPRRGPGRFGAARPDLGTASLPGVRTALMFGVPLGS